MTIQLITFENIDYKTHCNKSDIIETPIKSYDELWKTIKQVFIEKISNKHKVHSYDNICVYDADLLHSFFIDAIRGKIIDDDTNNTRKIDVHISYTYFSLYLASQNGFYKSYILHNKKDANCISKACTTTLMSKSDNIRNIMKQMQMYNTRRNACHDYKTSSICEYDISALRNMRNEAEHLMKMCDTYLKHITDTTIK